MRILAIFLLASISMHLHGASHPSQDLQRTIVHRNNLAHAAASATSRPPALGASRAPRSPSSASDDSSFLFSSDEDETNGNRTDTPYTPRNTLIAAFTLKNGQYCACLLPLDGAIQALLDAGSPGMWKKLSPEEAWQILLPLTRDHRIPMARHYAQEHGQKFAEELPDFIAKLKETQQRTLHVEVNFSSLRLAKATVAGLSAMACLFGAKSMDPRESNGRFIPVLAAASSASTVLKLTALVSACGFGLWQVRKIFGFMHDLAARNDELNEKNQALQTEAMLGHIKDYHSFIVARLESVELDVTLAHDNVSKLQDDLKTMKETLQGIGDTHAELQDLIHAACAQTDVLAAAIEKQAKRHRRHKERYQDAQAGPADDGTGVYAADPAAAGLAAIERAQATTADARTRLDAAIARNAADAAATAARIAAGAEARHGNGTGPS